MHVLITPIPTLVLRKNIPGGDHLQIWQVIAVRLARPPTHGTRHQLILAKAEKALNRLDCILVDDRLVKLVHHWCKPLILAKEREVGVFPNLHACDASLASVGS